MYVCKHAINVLNVLEFLLGIKRIITYFGCFTCKIVRPVTKAAVGIVISLTTALTFHINCLQK